MEINNIKKITPRFNYVITTADSGCSSKIITLGEDHGGLHSFQKVVAVGSFVKDIKVGDIVKINLTQYGKTKYEEGSIKENLQSMNPIVQYDVPTIMLNGVKHLFLRDNAIDFIVNRYEGDGREKKTPKKQNETKQAKQ